MYKQIKEILGKVKGNSDLYLNCPNNTDIINDIGLDSIQLIDFSLKLEEELHINIDFEKFNFCHLQSIENLYQFLQQSIPNNHK